MPANGSRRSKTWIGVQLNHLSMPLLVLQNSALALLMYYSRTMPLVDGKRYLPSTAVLLSELIKLCICLTMALYDSASRLPNAPATTLFGEVITSVASSDSWKLSIPAILYTLQNSLQYLSISNLSCPTFQITYQLKASTTAVFSLAILKQGLSLRRSGSLLAVVLGIALVVATGSSFAEDIRTLQNDPQVDAWFDSLLLGSHEGGKIAARLGVAATFKRSASYQGIDEDFALRHPHTNQTLGLGAVTIACICSGLAGVYFEKLLKYHNVKSRSGQRRYISIWVRNVQLASFSIIPALLIGVVLKDGDQIARDGFFAGYNWIVWSVVLLHSLGGILVGIVIDQASNAAKFFATSVSVIIVLVASMVLFDFSLSFQYLLGTTIVVGATWFFSLSERGATAPALVVEDYEKQQEQQQSMERSYFDSRTDQSRGLNTPSERGSTTSSRASSPAPGSGTRRAASGWRFSDKGD